jgi:toxin secretion/phage lysis holin
MKVIIILIGLDIVLGLLEGFINKELNSKFGLVGVIKHSIVILLLIAFKFITTEYNIGECYSLFLIFYVIQYSFSILEHVYKMGIPVPNFLVSRLKDYSEREGLKKWKK